MGNKEKSNTVVDIESRNEDDIYVVKNIHDLDLESLKVSDGKDIEVESLKSENFKLKKALDILLDL